MPQVRALKPVFHGGSLRLAGSLYEISEAHLANAKARWKEKKIRPPFELIVARKAEPEAEAADLV